MCFDLWRLGTIKELAWVSLPRVSDDTFQDKLASLIVLLKLLVGEDSVGPENDDSLHAAGSLEPSDLLYERNTSLVMVVSILRWDTRSMKTQDYSWGGWNN